MKRKDVCQFTVFLCPLYSHLFSFLPFRIRAVREKIRVHVEQSM